MEQIASTEALAQVIQLAVAPVFLLAGIAGLLGVLSTRLGRIIDRARVIERRMAIAKREEHRTLLHAEATSLWKRIDLINWAIRLCVTGALLICLVIVALFMTGLLRPAGLNVPILIAALFVLAMLVLIAGLLFLLREIHVATRQMRQGIEIALEEAATGAP
jgi:hypothetical protein